MSPVDVDEAFTPASACDERNRDLDLQIRAIHAQLSAISSRPALLDSYRREALNLLEPAYPRDRAASQALELAYVRRWRELPPEDAASRLR